ncbi:MAG TPA: DNA-formamidopyrimidine glycosylase family protein [Candidatus Polarisedimenticolia bacterium]|nr:DNA-formamidopyrimidine glycosylase family protein [Candidatus Polarisedimenticolia bacterium]
MPELPDIVVYLEALQSRILGSTLEGIRLGSPFVLRSVTPAPRDAAGRSVVGLRRLGKRLVIALEGGIFLVLHLMIAGRLQWKEEPGARLRRRIDMAAFDFSAGTLVLTEAGTRRRAMLHLVEGEGALAAHDPGGIDVLSAPPAAFRAALQRERHTLKRALTDPRLFSGIGNAYSDEILHRARLSPFRMSDALDPGEVERLRTACAAVLAEWTDRLRTERGDRFPAKVTAFREGMAVHGRHRKPCPDCGSPVQRIVYAENEANYCPRCQTGGRVLADRSLSRLLHDDWPRTIDELESRARGLKPGTEESTTR